MSNVPADLRYTREHEWAKIEGDRARIGITAFAQEQLGDVVFVELPKVGARVTAMQGFGVVESVKAVSDLFAPLSGEVGRKDRTKIFKPVSLAIISSVDRLLGMTVMAYSSLGKS